MFSVHEHLLCSATMNMRHGGRAADDGAQSVVQPAGSAASGARARMAAGASRWRFWATAYALLILLTGTNLPTPLYRSYETAFGFSPFVVTLIFAVYVATLVPSLLVAGPLSDAIGRRRVLLPALMLAAVGSLAFALATNTGWLFAARILQGLSVGAASGALTAALSELEPTGSRRKAALVTTVASVGGLGLGPVLGGLIAEYATAPDVTPFAVEIVLLIPAAVAVTRMPSTRQATQWRPRRPQIPAAMRTVFMTSGSANFLAFGVIGLFLTLIPTYVATLTGSTNLLLGGGTSALMLASSVAVQLITYGRRPRHLQLAGLPILAAGLGLLVMVGNTPSLELLLAAAVLAGAGHGLVFLGGLTTVNNNAPSTRHAEVLSSFYVIVYTGVGLPVLGVGVLATIFDLATAMTWFAGVVALLCLLVLAALSRTNRDTAAVLSK
ncbi:MULTISPECIES: MFS transporter [unclassified Streptomyces]|uniref:MFS transporter n=1 Tax=unclassified Streptomyces TaxID=2593676 RepID=UPI002DD9E178|nr:MULTISPECIES: MFS transporter [unclassified Streptomyces]WSA97602.1 MFS transporter [Streptomyces sp. NBC_01795]WSB82150.1 MFS transporter [Streptomyces sp. NBC_01775]WSS18121.1 MFS transporter [Streptomyces sp. NBC_01186]WSS46877.1 MFS transporter [Streptomyces sp. NBC_01187]